MVMLDSSSVAGLIWVSGEMLVGMVKGVFGVGVGVRWCGSLWG